MTDWQQRFYRGDIVDLMPSTTEVNKKLQNMRQALYTAKAHKLIVLRPLDENMYLVVVCKETEGKTQMVLETNKDPLYVKVMAFFPIDAASLRLCNGLYLKKNKSQVVEEIYTMHNELLEQRRKAGIEKIRKQRIKEQQKKAAARKAKAAQKQLENQYKQPYEIAVINNDTKRMKEIEEIVGYAPGRQGPSPSSGKRNGKVLYSNFNPRPCSGGRFTPK